ILAVIVVLEVWDKNKSVVLANDVKLPQVSLHGAGFGGGLRGDDSPCNTPSAFGGTILSQATVPRGSVVAGIFEFDGDVVAQAVAAIVAAGKLLCCWLLLRRGGRGSAACGKRGEKE